LASSNLPEALDCTSGNSLPQSLLDKSSAVRDNGYIHEINRTIQELPKLLKEYTDIFDVIQGIIRDEQESDDKLRTQFNERWTRTPPEGLTETFRASTAKKRKIISNAMQNDEAGPKKFENHRRGIVLTGPEGSDAESSPVHHLQKFMEDVQTLKTERDITGRKLRSAVANISTVLKPMARDGVIDEPAISSENLKRAFRLLVQQAFEYLQKQETLFAEIRAKDKLRREKNSAGCCSPQGAGCCF
jgi:hypothetical protein